MLTKWGKRALSLMPENSIVPRPSAGSYSATPCFVPIKDVKNTDCYICQAYRSTGTAAVFIDVLAQSYMDIAGVVFGSGNSQENEDSVFLDTQVIGLTSNSPVITQLTDNNGIYTVQFDFTLNNPTSEQVIIREVGMLKSAYANSNKGGIGYGGQGSKLVSFMIDRAVLSVPVIINPGDPGIVRYKFMFDYSEF